MKDYEYSQIYDLLEPRLDQLGEIAIKDACEIVKWPYQMVRKVFKETMDTMVEQGKAEKVVNGRYKILKPNRK